MRLLLLMTAALSASPAGALGLGAGLTETVGSQHYAGTSAYARFRQDEWSVKPAYSQYHSDASNGTYQTISARGAYDVDRFGAGLTAGGTPLVNGYSNSFFGIDGEVSLMAPEKDAARLVETPDTTEKRPKNGFLSAVDVGAGLTRTEHRDEAGSQVVDTRRRGEQAVGPGGLSIGQTDLRAWISAETHRHRASLDVAKSLYDRDLGALSPGAARVVGLSGFSGVIQGFPSASASLRYEYDGLPVVSPFASYTYAAFELDQPHADIVTAGVYIDVKPATLSASYQNLTQSGLPDLHYLAFGGSVRF